MRRLLPLLAVLVAALAAAGPAAAASPTQPSQPGSGLGGSDYTHAGVRISSGGVGANAWFVFEPTDPKPASAPLDIFTHGYGEYDGYASLEALIRQTVRKGDVAIYTRWQTSLVTPCPGPFAVEPCLQSEVAGIKGALAFLAADPDRVQPQLDQTSYFGFSFGGIVTANVLNHYQQLGIPRPRAVFLDDPHDGGYTGDTEPTLDDDLGGIPSDTRFVCHSGAEGVTGEPGSDGKPKKPDASCNSLFPKLTSIPEANKAIVLTSPDDHGSPALSSKHGVCESGASDGLDYGTLDAYDVGFCFKQWESLRACALQGTDCSTALDDTPEHRYIGTWSDGTPIIGLKIQKQAPIRPTPVPDRAPQPQPASTPTVTTPAPAQGTPTPTTTTPASPAIGPQPIPSTAPTGTATPSQLIVRFYGRKRAAKGVLVTLVRSAGSTTGVVVELRRAGRVIARSSARTVSTKRRRVVLRRSGGRRLSPGTYSLVVRTGSTVLQRRSVTLRR